MKKRRFYLSIAILATFAVHLCTLYLCQDLNLGPRFFSEWRQKTVELEFFPASSEEFNLKSALSTVEGEPIKEENLLLPSSLFSFSSPQHFFTAEDRFRLQPLSSTQISSSLPWGKDVEENLPLVEKTSSFSASQQIDLPLFSTLENNLEGNDIPASEHFSISVEYTPRSFQSGYIFRIQLVPKAETYFKRIRQNYYFLLDRSNSVPRSRYFLNKKGVLESLSLLQPGDTFNILIFDDRVVRLSATSLPWNEENLLHAKQFLENQPHGGAFSATDIYTSLGKILPQNVPSEEVNTAILLSDGDTYLTLEKQRQTIGGWTLKNAGKVALFSFASGTGNNLSLLELISSFNRGSLVYVNQNDLIVPRLKQLILSLQHPICKDLTAKAISSEKQMIIHLQPKNNRLAHLYRHRPYVIWGWTNRLSDFTLFLQGYYYDRPVDIKKKISFRDALPGTPSLERQWAQLVAQEHYECYFQDGKTSHLEAARRLLAPLEMPIPFSPSGSR